MSDDIKQILEKLDRYLTAEHIPAEYRRIDLAGVAAMLDVSETTARTKFVCLPSFPKPYRSAPTDHPRWLAREVHEWWMRERDRINRAA